MLHSLVGCMVVAIIDGSGEELQKNLINDYKLLNKIVAAYKADEVV